MRHTTCLTTAALLGLGLATAARAGGDAESATHDDLAAIPQRSWQDERPEFVIRQYQLGCLSQLTYLLGSAGVGVVVDPQRDVEHYIRDAKELGLEIRYVVLTHTNADFVAGHTELAARAGSQILISARSNSAFPHRGLNDGDTLDVGKARLTFWATPGHTLDAMSVLVHVPGALADPAYALTGDTLFIGGIGRPDLVGGDVTPTVLANLAFDSIQRLRGLPDATLVLPAHGAGSLCGAHLSPETVSTVGQERQRNPFFSARSRASFVSETISGLPLAPGYFRHNVRINRAGPPVLTEAPPMPAALPPAEVKARLEQGAWLVDLRAREPYAAGHVAGSVNISVRGRLDTWIGTVVPFDAPLLLIGSEDEVREATFRLRRIGFDQPSGYVAGGIAAWQQAGLPVRTTKLMTPQELKALIDRGAEPLLVDVRTASEYAEVRVGDYANIAVSDWPRFKEVLDPAQPLVLLCNSAYRSSMAVGLAERSGFQDVANLSGGLEAWMDAGLPVQGTQVTARAPEAAASAGAAPGGELVLPEGMRPRDLADLLETQPNRYALFDLRPAWQFEEFHLPGAMRVELSELDGRVRALPAGVRAVLLDRDGSLAAQAATAVLARQPTREVRFLVGGTAAWWAEVELGGSLPAGAPRGPAPSAEPAPPAAAPTAPTAPASPSPSPRRIPRAGC